MDCGNLFERKESRKKEHTLCKIQKAQRVGHSELLTHSFLADSDPVRHPPGFMWSFRVFYLLGVKFASTVVSTSTGLECTRVGL